MGKEESWRTDNPVTEKESYLHESNWNKHVAKRPEIDGHLYSLRDTVSDPDVAIEKKGAIHKYRMGYGSGKTRGMWLLAIERPDLYGAHCVRSMYFVPDFEEGTILRFLPRAIGGRER